MKKISFEKNVQNRMNHYGVNRLTAIDGFLNDHDAGLVSWEQYGNDTVLVREDGAEPYVMEESELYKFWQE